MGHDSMGGGHGHGNGHGHGHGNGHGYGHGHENEHGQNALDLREILNDLLKDNTPDHGHTVDAHIEHFQHSENLNYLEYSGNSEHLIYSDHSEHSQYLNLNVENYQVPTSHQHGNTSGGGNDSLVGGHGDDIISFSGLGDHSIQHDIGNILPFQLGDIHFGPDTHLSVTHHFETSSNVTFEFTDGESSITLVGMSASEITTHLEILGLS
ncbi:hypothetical protein [Nitrosomonas sp. Is37]|uniref:hypothetical protein n=1 Tax=Nitrosomonas sp. Is37 TaxID=3080535 RepID=UPI00294B0B34|nr:hypothetical protein [Nitrosomonas sp. Is37]MDV6343775.1 hypothetical protein [Nitrosomonas sp. Is37]